MNTHVHEGLATQQPSLVVRRINQVHVVEERRIVRREHPHQAVSNMCAESTWLLVGTWQRRGGGVRCGVVLELGQVPNGAEKTAGARVLPATVVLGHEDAVRVLEFTQGHNPVIEAAEVITADLVGDSGGLEMQG